MEKVFGAADICLPKKGINMEKWSVVACDQFTSEPEYWKETEEIVEDAPSTLKMILPEVYLDGEDEEERLQKIGETMKTYLEENPDYKVAVDQMVASNVNVQEPFDIINWEIDEVIKNNMAEFGAGNQDKDTTLYNIVEQCNEKLAAYVRANG